MIRRHPKPTLTASPFPFPTLCRSGDRRLTGRKTSMLNEKTVMNTGTLALSRRGLLKGAPAAIAGAAIITAGDLLTAAPAMAADGVFSTPDYDAIIRKAVEGKVIKVGFTPPILSEFFDIMRSEEHTSELQSLMRI